MEMNKHVFTRLKAIKCPKCVYIKWQDVFCNKDLCSVYDKETNLSYFRDGFGHLSLFGRYFLYKPMRENIDRALKI